MREGVAHGCSKVERVRWRAGQVMIDLCPEAGLDVRLQEPHELGLARQLPEMLLNQVSFVIGQQTARVPHFDTDGTQAIFERRVRQQESAQRGVAVSCVVREPLEGGALEALR